jgi:site-specific DNA recombinase
MRAAIYARVSTEEQTRGHSITDQVAACRRIAQARGWSVADEYLDEGESGGSFAKRTAWRRLMAAAEARRFDVLICDRIDRFSRATVLDALTTLDALRKHGVTFVTASEPFDLSHPAGEMMLLMLLALARQYLVNLSRVVTRGRRSRAQSGKSNANRPPFGYRRVNGMDVVHKPERKIVRELFERAAQPTWSVVRLAEWLNTSGHRMTGGQRFSRAAVSEMLRNRFYAGYVMYRGVREPLAETKRRKRSDAEWLPGQHEAILTADEFARAQSGVARRRTGQFRRNEKSANFYTLRGLLVCAECGRPMFGSRTHTGKARYTCTSSWRGEPCEAAHTTVREDVLMPQIDAALARLDIGDDLLAAAEATANANEDSAPQADRRAEIEQEKLRLDVMFRRGRVPLAQYEREHDALDAELATLADIVPLTATQAAVTVHSLVDGWAHAADASTRRDLLAALVQSIEIDARTKRITAWVPIDDFRKMFKSGGIPCKRQSPNS